MHLARLKPLNERKGHKVKLYMIAGLRFYVERGWYEVSDEIAEKLRGLHQDHYDLESPLLFDVVTPAEAETMERSERAAAATTRATVQQPATPESYRQPSDAKPLDELLDDASGSEEDDREAGRMASVGRVGSKGPRTRQKR